MATEVQRLELRIRIHQWVALLAGIPAALFMVGRFISGNEAPDLWGLALSVVAIMSAAGIIGLRTRLREARQRLLDEALAEVS